VLEYDRRHGYRGPEAYASLPAEGPDLEEAIEEALQDRDVIGELVPAVVLEASAREVHRHRAQGRRGQDQRRRAQVRGARADRAQSRPGDPARRGDPAAGRGQGHLVDRAAAARRIGAGGGRPAQRRHPRARRRIRLQRQQVQPRDPGLAAAGSSFKPFIYSAALEKGFTPATVLNDAPFVIEAAKTGGQLWEPKNYDGKYEGPMRLRTALAKSKNMVSIRLLQAIGPHYAQDYVQRFGFDPKMHPAYLTMALGAGATTPLQMAGAYSVFANGGYRVKPWFISRIEDNRGEVLYASKPEVAGQDAERVLDERNAFIMTSLMRDVVRYGTAARAMSLGRQDLAGKTGTTNDHVDAWFAGFQGQLVAVAWIGYDAPTNLGRTRREALRRCPSGWLTRPRC
jgi:penicillin-binding protein 1A